MKKLCLTWGILFLALTARGASVDSLGPQALQWTQWSLDYLDSQWQDQGGYLGGSIRGTAQYALGLLMRGTEGDVARATRAMNNVLSMQYDAPGTAWHGTFRRSPNDKPPPPNSKVWIDYDPNWREFICTIQILALKAFPGVLPPETETGMQNALRLAAEGAHARRVNAEYSNISIMSAYLLSEAGTRFDNEAWRSHGRDLAEKIHANFQSNASFDEYNSPTYYGVDLYAIALWRAYPVYPEMEAMGRAMEEGLWRDMARFYHAGLRNFAGPYDRSYGMDLNQYTALAAFWIAFNVPPETAPLPRPAIHPPKAGEFATLPAYALLGSAPPAEVLPHFTVFQGSRRLSRHIGAKGKRGAYAWLDENLIVGAGETEVGRLADTQHHPFTVHWRMPDGRIAWIRLRAHLGVRASLTEEEARIRCRPLSKHQDLPETSFEIYPPDLAASTAFTRTVWKMPGLTLHIATPSPTMRIDAKEKTLHLRYVPPSPMPKKGVPFVIRWEQ